MRSYGLPEVIVDGEVIEVKPPFKLVQTYRLLFNEEHVKEGFTRLTFEIERPPRAASAVSRSRTTPPARR